VDNRRNWVDGSGDGPLNLKAAVEREKVVQAIDGHRECKNWVVTFWVMSSLFHFLGTARGCADFRDPTVVFRFKSVRKKFLKNGGTNIFC
jgi:hypothetical protein